MDRRARILVVDDDENIRTVFKVNLEDKGYRVDTASNGKDAIRKLIVQQFNMALIDVRLPDVSGIEILDAVERYSPTAVKLIVTGFPTMQNAIEAVNSGADGYILKPVNIEEFLTIIEDHLERQQRKERFYEDKVSELIEAKARELQSQLKFYAPIS